MPLRAEIDTGMTRTNCEIGLSLTPFDFDRVGLASQPRLVERYGAEGGAVINVRVAIGRIGIDGLDGSDIETRIARLNSNLLGVCFFHRIPEFEMHWDFASRAMTIRRRIG